MPDGVVVTVDASGLNLLAEQFDAGTRAAMIRLLDQGEEFIREEAPERTGNLKGKRNAGGSVSSEYLKTETGYSGTINISAIRERQNATTGTLVSPKGKQRPVQLRAQPAFDYAEVVATGRPRLTAPRNARAFLIPVQSAPSGESYITARGQIFVVRKTVGPQKPNDYPGRALTRLGGVAEAITLKALQDAVSE